jgi:hypothetical protein
MLQRAPVPLLILLGLFFLLEVVSVLLTGELFQLARIAVVGIAAWKTLQGSRPAAFFLGGLFALGALIALWTAVGSLQVEVVAGVVYLVGALFLGTISAYVFLSPKMKALYAVADGTRWRPN